MNIRTNQPYDSLTHFSRGQDYLATVGGATGDSAKTRGGRFTFGNSLSRMSEIGNIRRHTTQEWGSGIMDAPWSKEDIQREYPDFQEEAEILQPEAANERYGIDGHLSWDKPVSSLEAYVLHQRKQEEIKYNYSLDQAHGHEFAKGMAIEMGMAILDPAAIPFYFIPPLGAARLIAITGATATKVGTRFIQGGLGGLYGSAAIEPFIYGAAQQEQAEYGLAESFVNVGFGAVAGGSLYALGGALYDGGAKLAGIKPKPVDFNPDGHPTGKVYTGEKPDIDKSVKEYYERKAAKDAEIKAAVERARERKAKEYVSPQTKFRQEKGEVKGAKDIFAHQFKPNELDNEADLLRNRVDHADGAELKEMVIMARILERSSGAKPSYKGNFKVEEKRTYVKKAIDDWNEHRYGESDPEPEQKSDVEKEVEADLEAEAEYQDDPEYKRLYDESMDDLNGITDQLHVFGITDINKAKKLYKIMSRLEATIGKKLGKNMEALRGIFGARTGNAALDGYVLFAKPGDFDIPTLLKEFEELQDATPPLTSDIKIYRGGIPIPVLDGINGVKLSSNKDIENAKKMIGGIFIHERYGSASLSEEIADFYESTGLLEAAGDYEDVPTISIAITAKAGQKVALGNITELEVGFFKNQAFKITDAVIHKGTDSIKFYVEMIDTPEPPKPKPSKPKATTAKEVNPEAVDMAAKQLAAGETVEVTPITNVDEHAGKDIPKKSLTAGQLKKKASGTSITSIKDEIEKGDYADVANYKGGKTHIKRFLELARRQIDAVGEYSVTILKGQFHDNSWTNEQIVKRREFTKKGGIAKPFARLDKMFKRLPKLQKKIRIYRGGTPFTVLDGANGLKLADNLDMDTAKNMIGGTFTNKYYTNSSINQEVSDMFDDLAMDMNGRPPPISLIIDVPEGNKLAIASPSELEVVLDRGTTFKIKKVGEVEFTNFTSILQFTVEVVDSPKPKAKLNENGVPDDLAAELDREAAAQENARDDFPTDPEDYADWLGLADYDKVKKSAKNNSMTVGAFLKIYHENQEFLMQKARDMGYDEETIALMIEIAKKNKSDPNKQIETILETNEKFGKPQKLKEISKEDAAKLYSGKTEEEAGLMDMLNSLSESEKVAMMEKFGFKFDKDAKKNLGGQVVDFAEKLPKPIQNVAKSVIKGDAPDNVLELFPKAKHPKSLNEVKASFEKEPKTGGGPVSDEEISNYLSTTYGFTKEEIGRIKENILDELEDFEDIYILEQEWIDLDDPLLSFRDYLENEQGWFITQSRDEFKKAKATVSETDNDSIIVDNALSEAQIEEAVKFVADNSDINEYGDAIYFIGGVVDTATDDGVSIETFGQLLEMVQHDLDKYVNSDPFELITLDFDYDERAKEMPDTVLGNFALLRKTQQARIGDKLTEALNFYVYGVSLPRKLKQMAGITHEGSGLLNALYDQGNQSRLDFIGATMDIKTNLDIKIPESIGDDSFEQGLYILEVYKDMLDEGIEKNITLPVPVKVYRGGTLPIAFEGIGGFDSGPNFLRDPFGDEAIENLNKMIGHVMEADEVTSTSLDEVTAKHFADTEPLMFLEIDLPAGQKHLIAAMGEQEILLPQGTLFEITGVRTFKGKPDTNGFNQEHIITMKALLPEDDPRTKMTPSQAIKKAEDHKKEPSNGVSDVNPDDYPVPEPKDVSDIEAQTADVEKETSELEADLKRMLRPEKDSDDESIQNKQIQSDVESFDAEEILRSLEQSEADYREDYSDISELNDAHQNALDCLRDDDL